MSPNIIHHEGLLLGDHRFIEEDSTLNAQAKCNLTKLHCNMTNIYDQWHNPAEGYNSVT